MRLRPGDHTVTLAAEGYLDWSETVRVEVGERVAIPRVHLVPSTTEPVSQGESD